APTVKRADLIDRQVIIDGKVRGRLVDLVLGGVRETTLHHQRHGRYDLLGVAPYIAVQFELSPIRGELRTVGDRMTLRTRHSGLSSKTGQRTCGSARQDRNANRNQCRRGITAQSLQALP